MRPPPLAIGQLDPRPGAEIDLGLLARLALHAAKRQRAGPSQLGHEPPHAVVLVVEPVADQGPGRSAGPRGPAPTSPGSPADRARRRCGRRPSPRKLPPSKPRCRPPSRGAIGPDRQRQKWPPSRWALWLVLTLGARGALWLVLNWPGGTSGKGERRAGLDLPFSSPDGSAGNGPPRALRGLAVRPHRSRWALWLVLERNCCPDVLCDRLPVYVQLPGNPPFRQPCSCNLRIAWIFAIVSRFAM